MYKPAPPRPKKTNLVRSRSGCKGCRQRRVKCDEKKPSCSACMRHGKKCEAITPNFDFRIASVLADESQGFRSAKRFKMVYNQELPSQQTAANIGMNTYGFDESLDGPYVADDAVLNMPSSDDQVFFSTDTPQINSQDPSLSSLPSPVTTRSFIRSGNELLYLRYWENSCAPALHQFWRQTAMIADHYAPLMQALLALSACNMSRSFPEGDLEPSCIQVRYRPRRENFLSSQYYYLSAVRQVARSIGSNTSTPPSHKLAILVLFCYLESATGNFAGFGCHAQGIGRFIQAHFELISSDPLGRELTAAWTLASCHTWWLRMNFSSFLFQLSQRSLCLPADVSKILQSIDARRAIVASILCESYRLKTIALLQLGPHARYKSGVTVDNCITSLALESKKLDQWHSALPQYELPIESFSSFEPSTYDDIRPLLFKSHGFAMNYVYYVSSRIMQCTALFHNLQSSHRQLNETDEAEITYWMTILLRIAAGLDKQNCARKNVYSIGVTSLLVACLLQCHNPTFGQWIENWLCEWNELSVLEEGSFPIVQALEVARLVNREKAAGNNVYAIALPEDDGGGGGKHSSYCSQRVDRLVLMGARWSSGRLYSECISVNMER